MGRDVEVDLRPERTYRLPEALRPELARPWGPVLQTPELPAALAGHAVAAVGDFVALTLLRLGIAPRLIAVDLHTQRGARSEEYARAFAGWGDRAVRVLNPPGEVTRAAWDAVRLAFAEPGTTRIEVEGEEDLLGIPVFLECPLGTRVLYGAPGRGAVVVTVDASFRQHVRDLVARFERA